MLRWLTIVVVACVSLSCSQKPVGAVVADTPRSAWNPEECVEVRYGNCDTLSLYEVTVVARRQASDGDGAVPLRVVATTPSGATFGGEVILAPRERHKGGSFVELSAEWIKEAQLGEIGEYVFALSPITELEGVWTVGVQIQN